MTNYFSVGFSFFYNILVGFCNILVGFSFFCWLFFCLYTLVFIYFLLYFLASIFFKNFNWIKDDPDILISISLIFLFIFLLALYPVLCDLTSDLWDHLDPDEADWCEFFVGGFLGLCFNTIRNKNRGKNIKDWTLS